MELIIDMDFTGFSGTAPCFQELNLLPTLGWGMKTSWNSSSIWISQVSPAPHLYLFESERTLPPSGTLIISSLAAVCGDGLGSIAAVAGCGTAAPNNATTLTKAVQGPGSTTISFPPSLLLRPKWDTPRMLHTIRMRLVVDRESMVRTVSDSHTGIRPTIWRGRSPRCRRNASGGQGLVLGGTVAGQLVDEAPGCVQAAPPTPKPQRPGSVGQALPAPGTQPSTLPSPAPLC